MPWNTLHALPFCSVLQISSFVFPFFNPWGCCAFEMAGGNGEPLRPALVALCTDVGFLTPFSLSYLAALCISQC